MTFSISRTLLISSVNYQPMEGKDLVLLSNHDSSQPKLDITKEEMLQKIWRYDFTLGTKELMDLGIDLKGTGEEKLQLLAPLKGRRLQMKLFPKPIRDGRALKQEDLIVTEISSTNTSNNFYTKRGGDENTPKNSRFKGYGMQAWSPNENSIPMYYLVWSLSKEEYVPLRKIHLDYAMGLVLKLK